MLMPSLLSTNLFNDFFDDDWFDGRAVPAPERKHVPDRMPAWHMSTDIKETDEGYELEMNLPGYSKDEVSAKLENGYMTIEAIKNESNDETDEKTGKYIRRERYTGSCKRSFYVGEDITEQDIKASFKDGILCISIPKKDPKEIQKTKTIAIEG